MHWDEILAHIVSIVSTVVIMLALHEFRSQKTEEKDIHFYDDFEVMGSDARKVATVGYSWAIVSVVGQAAIAIVFWQMEVKANLVRAIALGLQFVTNVPAVAILLMVMCGFDNKGEIYKGAQSFGEEDSAVPALKKCEDILMLFGIAISLVVGTAAIGNTMLTKGTFLHKEATRSHVIQKVSYSVAMILLFGASIIIVMNPIHHTNPVPLGANQTSTITTTTSNTANITSTEQECFVEDKKLKLYEGMRICSVPLSVLIMAELLLFVVSIFQQSVAESIMEKKWLYWMLNVVFAIKWIGMFCVLYSFAMTMSTYPCLIPDEEHVDGGTVFAFGVLSLFVVGVTQVTAATSEDEWFGAATKIYF